MKGVSERIKRTLKRANIRTAFRPLETLSKIFKKPKDSLILKYQELFIKLSVRIVISRTFVRVSVRGIHEEKNAILADEPTMNLLLNITLKRQGMTFIQSMPPFLNVEY